MSDRPILQRSVNTERALALPRPRLKGISHLLAAIAAVPASIIGVAAAPPGRPRLGVLSFAVGITVMFTCSALLHRRRWSATTYERLFRLDHTGIYLAIGGTGAAVALLGLTGVPRTVLLVAFGLGVVVGIVVEWLPFAPPKGFNNAVFLSLGWVPMLLLPWLWIEAGVLVIGLLLLGGVLYTAGAIVVGTRRPDPSPRWFGYHEVFHLLVILAVLAHVTMISVLVHRQL